MPIPAFLFNPLVIKVIAGVAIVLGVTVWWNVHNYRVRQAAIAEYKVRLKDCSDATDAAVSANKSLQASTDKLVAKVREQNEQIVRIQTAEVAAKRAKDEALARALAKERSLREEISRLTVIANAPAIPATTVEVCNEARDILRGLVAGGM